MVIILLENPYGDLCLLYMREKQPRLVSRSLLIKQTPSKPLLQPMIHLSSSSPSSQLFFNESVDPL